MTNMLLSLGISSLLALGNPGSMAQKTAPSGTYFPADSQALLGRWDLTIDANGRKLPSWLEVRLSGYRTLVGSFVGSAGSARPIAQVDFRDGEFSFTIPPQWEGGDGNIVVRGKVSGESMQGTLTSSDGKQYTWSGVRAPLLTRQAAPVWGSPLNLFNGHDLQGWKATGDNQWIVRNEVLTSPHSGANLVTEKTFTDFKLHVEFRYNEGSNSGVYLRGRYEVQIEDNPAGTHPNSEMFSGIYGFLPPTHIAARGPGRWQTYDITLVGRMVTVVANGDTVICHREIPGITGGALDSHEDQPGPIYIQGDHGPIEYRKIIITPAR